jgi:hypothetical protein
MKFSTRDILWFTLVLCLIFGWRTDSQHTAEARRILKNNAWFIGRRYPEDTHWDVSIHLRNRDELKTMIKWIDETEELYFEDDSLNPTFSKAKRVR